MKILVPFLLLLGFRASVVQIVRVGANARINAVVLNKDTATSSLFVAGQNLAGKIVPSWMLSKNKCWNEKF